jgi:hypothetical protein
MDVDTPALALTSRPQNTRIQEWGCPGRDNDLLFDRGFHEAEILDNDNGAFQSDQLHEFHGR